MAVQIVVDVRPLAAHPGTDVRYCHNNTCGNETDQHRIFQQRCAPLIPPKGDSSTFDFPDHSWNSHTSYSTLGSMTRLCARSALCPSGSRFHRLCTCLTAVNRLSRHLRSVPDAAAGVPAERPMFSPLISPLRRGLKATRGLANISPSIRSLSTLSTHKVALMRTRRSPQSGPGKGGWGVCGREITDCGRKFFAYFCAPTMPRSAPRDCREKS